MAEFVEVMKWKKRMCNTYNKDCRTVTKCPLDYDRNGKNMICTDFLAEYPQESEEIIMKWAKEHPIKTNRDKFKEVFGILPIMPDKDWWNEEYIEPKGENK